MARRWWGLVATVKARSHDYVILPGWQQELERWLKLFAAWKVIWFRKWVDPRACGEAA
jgi:hypothetical protein